MTREAQLALGRIFRIMARPEQLDDVADYQRCRAIIMDAAPNPEPDYQPNYARDRLKGAKGD